MQVYLYTGGANQYAEMYAKHACANACELQSVDCFASKMSGDVFLPFLVPGAASDTADRSLFPFPLRTATCLYENVWGEEGVAEYGGMRV